jgi:hypothetical protein
MSEISDLKDQIRELEQEIDRLNARLNVALELLGSCKMSGSPENAGLVQQRLEEALRTEHESAAPEDSTGKIRAVAPAAAAPSLRSSPSAATQGVDRVEYTPSVPTEAPLASRETRLSQQDHQYDHFTEGDRKLSQALDVLDTLGKKK